MRQLALVFFLLVFGIHAKAQLLADFETPPFTPTISSQTGAAAGVRDNPDLEGNPSTNVAYYKKTSGNWRAVYLIFPTQQNIGKNDQLVFKIRSSTQGRVFVKVVNGNTTIHENWAPDYTTQPLPNKWTQCVLNVTPIKDQPFTRIEVNSSVDNNAEADVYLDDFRLVNSASPDGEPIIQLSVSSFDVPLGQSISFDALASIAQSGSIVSYVWNFGDGNSASGGTGNHTYQSSGVFNATLNVTDSNGKSSQSIFTINVRPTESKFSSLSIISPDLRTYEKIEASFLLRDQYSNVYDPEIVAIDALITLPNQTKITVPCFYFQQAKYAPDLWVVTSQNGHWRLRFTSSQSGEHSIQLRLKDASGETLSDIKKVTLTAGNAKGIVKMDAANKQYYRHTTGEPYYPLGINAGWGSTSNYTTIINNLKEGGANLVRYWQVPFDRQGLEWRAGSGFYQGLGKYSQEAAAEQDSMISLCAARDIQLQIVLFQHGMFSETVDSNWADNPYNAANGGPLLFSEQYFSDPTAKVYTKKLLRYIVARWGYSRHLFAWELFNEVHFTGNHPNQTPNWYPAVRAWHDEMGQYIKSLDAFDHIVSSSSSDSHLVDFDKLQGLDNVQYHLYNTNLLSVQIARDRDLLSKMTRTGLICGEYGLDVTTADVPFDVQRLAIWTGIMTQVPHLMWKWENYMDPDWANLFQYPNKFLQQEDFANEGNLQNWAFTTMASVSGLGVVGMQSSKNFYGLVYDMNHRSNLAGVEAVLSNLPGGNYTITYFDALTGATIEVDKDLKSNDRLVLPTFSKAVAFKLKFNFPLVLGLDNLSNALKVNIFPNPTDDIVNITLDNSTERLERVRLISTLGVEHFVFTSMPSYSDGYQIRLGNIGIPSGVYILQIETDRTFYSHRISYSAANSN